MNQPENTSKGFGGAMTIAAWIVLLLLLAMYFKELQDTQINPNQSPKSELRGERQVLVLESNKYNHFVMTGKINGVKTPLLLDTGATQVAVPENMARKLKLTPGKASIANTANGSVKVFNTNIEKLELGNIVLYNVPAQINPGMNGLGEVLLGMSALSRLEFRQRDGTLELIL